MICTWLILNSRRHFPLQVWKLKKGKNSDNSTYFSAFSAVMLGNGDYAIGFKNVCNWENKFNIYLRAYFRSALPFQRLKILSHKAYRSSLATTSLLLTLSLTGEHLNICMVEFLPHYFLVISYNLGDRNDNVTDLPETTTQAAVAKEKVSYKL